MTFNEECEFIEESRLKSTVLAGLVASGVAQGAKTDTTTTPPSREASAVSIQQMPDSVILRFITDFTANAEGFRENVYKCSKGKLTIGYGTNLEDPSNAKKLKGMGYDVEALKRGTAKIDKTDAKLIFKSGLKNALEDGRKFVSNFDSLPLRVKGIITDMSYNLGLTKLNKFKEFKRGLLARDFKYAKHHMIKSGWYSQVGNRSKALVKIMDNVIKLER